MIWFQIIVNRDKCYAIQESHSHNIHFCGRKNICAKCGNLENEYANQVKCLKFQQNSVIWVFNEFPLSFSVAAAQITISQNTWKWFGW